jgi:hypothetical protein
MITLAKTIKISHLWRTIKTNNMKQTAVEWLVSELKKYDSAGLKDQSNYVIEMPTHILTELEEQAKEMEKQQIIDAFNVGFKDRGLSFLQGEQYYNKTFKNK